MTILAGGHGGPPITVALVNDYRVVVERLRDMLLPFGERVIVVDMEIGTEDIAPADVALFDTLGGQRHALTRARALVERRGVDHVIIYARDPSPAFVLAAEAVGVDDVIDKITTGEALVAAIEAVAHDHPPPARGRAKQPRPSAGEITGRDQELLALLAKGLSNDEIADELFIGVATVRTHLQHLYRRLHVANRAQAAQRAALFGLAGARPAEEPTGRRRAKHFQHVPHDVRAARSFVASELRRWGATDHEVQTFRLAVSELAANAVAHGAGNGWTVGVTAEREWLTMDVWGGHAGADSVIFHPERWLIADVHQPTGRGLGIVRQLVDEVTAVRWRGQVRVVCRLRRADGQPTGVDRQPTRLDG